MPAARRHATSGTLSRRRFCAVAGGAAVALVADLPGAALARAARGPLDVGLPPASYPALFQSREIVLGEPLQFLPKVRTLLDSLAGTPGHGDGRLGRWHRLLAELAGRDPLHQVEDVNRFVNEVRYVDDRRNWGVSDRWATPDEFFTNGGDCEDFALAKFVSLHRLGFNVGRLRMVLANDRRKAIHHAFLVVYLGDHAYVLDNQIKTVTPHGAISHYQPLCSFNDHRLWVHRS